MKKKVLITGITGQDGSYLAEFLLGKDYEVYGMVRRTSLKNYGRIDHIIKDLELVNGDLTDQSSLDNLIHTIQPDEVYNLAAQSFVSVSFEQPILTSEITGLGVVKILEAIRKFKKDVKFYQASSSEMFGKVKETPQNENTPFYPRSPYGCAKAFGHYVTVNFRESYKMFCCSGILFNHESPRRGLEFVTRKITSTVAKIKLGVTDRLELGNLDAKRDWGFAGDYVEAMWLMLQQEKPEDYVVSTGETHTVKEFVDIAFKVAGITNPDKYVHINPKFIRPAEVDLLLGNSTKAKRKLRWKPKIEFEELVRCMVLNDIDKEKYRLHTFDIRGDIRVEA